jgi:hypothetical protein
MYGPGKLVGPMRINHYLRVAHAVSNTACCTHDMNIGQALIPVCETGILFSMCKEASTFPAS